MGEEHQGLIGLGGPLGVQLVDHDGQRNGDDDAQNDEDDIVKKRIPQEHGECVIVDEEGKILEPHKLAVEQIVKEGLPGEDLVLLEGDDQAEHRQVAEQDIPDKRGKTQQAQLQIVPCQPVPFGTIDGEGLPGFFGVSDHKQFPPFLKVKNVNESF